MNVRYHKRLQRKTFFSKIILESVSFTYHDGSCRTSIAVSIVAISSIFLDVSRSRTNEYTVAQADHIFFILRDHILSSFDYVLLKLDPSKNSKYRF
jgi:hypothetical protein